MLEREIRDIAFVPRWAIIRTVRNQSCAEHSYFVAVYAQQIAKACCWRGPMGSLLDYALWHDMDEIFTGDMVSSAKKMLKKAAGPKWEEFTSWVNELTKDRFGRTVEGDMPANWRDDIKHLVKIADLLEAAFFLRDEMALGNTNVNTVYTYIHGHLMAAMEEGLRHVLQGHDPWGRRRKEIKMLVDKRLAEHGLVNSKLVSE